MLVCPHVCVGPFSSLLLVSPLASLILHPLFPPAAPVPAFLSLTQHLYEKDRLCCVCAGLRFRSSQERFFVQFAR